MVGEFEIQTREMTDDKTSDKIVKMINLDAEEFPCLFCPIQCGVRQSCLGRKMVWKAA